MNSEVLERLLPDISGEKLAAVTHCTSALGKNDPGVLARNDPPQDTNGGVKKKWTPHMIFREFGARQKCLANICKANIHKVLWGISAGQK
jgi:hypothetical protein